jgi:hypothetical protein
MSSTPLLLLAALTASALAGDATKPDPSSSNNESDATKVSNLAKQFGDASQAGANCNAVAGKKVKCKDLCPDLTKAIKCAVDESGKEFRAADKTSAAGGAAKVEFKDALLAQIANSGKQADKEVVDSKEDANKRCDERETKFTGLKKTVDDAADKFQSSTSTPAERDAASKVIKDAAADPDKWHIKNRVLKAKRADLVAKQIEKTIAKEGKDSNARVICAKVKLDGSKLDTLRTKAKEINVDSDANRSDVLDIVDKSNDDSFDGTSFKPTKPNCRPKPKCVKPIVKPSPNEPTKPVPGEGSDPNKPTTGGDKPVVKPPVNAPPPPPSGDQKPPVNQPPSGDQKPPVNPPPSGEQKPPVDAPAPVGPPKPPTGDVPKPAPAPVDPAKPPTGDAPKPAPAPVDPAKPPTGDAPKPDPAAPVPAPAPGSDPNKVPAPVPGGFNQAPAPVKPPGQDAGSGAGEKPPADGSGKAPEGSNSGSGGDPTKPDGSGSGEKPDGSGSEPGKPGSGEKPDGSGSGEKPDGSGEKPGSGEGHNGDNTTDDEDCEEVPADSKEKGSLKKRHGSHDDEDCNEVSDEDKTEGKTEGKTEDKTEDEKDEDEKADHDRDPATPSKVPTKRQEGKVSCEVFVPTTAANADLTSVQVAAMLGDLDAEVESVDIVGEEDVEIVKAVVVKSPKDNVGGSAATQVLAASAVLSAAVARLFW